MAQAAWRKIEFIVESISIVDRKAVGGEVESAGKAVLRSAFEGEV